MDWMKAIGKERELELCRKVVQLKEISTEIFRLPASVAM